MKNWDAFILGMIVITAIAWIGVTANLACNPPPTTQDAVRAASYEAELTECIADTQKYPTKALVDRCRNNVDCKYGEPTCMITIVEPGNTPCNNGLPPLSLPPKITNELDGGSHE